MRLFFIILYLFVGAATWANEKAVPLYTLTATEQLARMQAGTITSAEIVSSYLARIEGMDRQGIKIQAIIALNPSALSLAKLRDKQRNEGKLLGPLHGTVVLVKDNIEVASLPTTAGSLALQQNMTQRDAPIIKKLKNAGAIILGKTNLSEWANFRSYDSISGWSGIGGQTRNPHSLDRSPCGSSSGTGAAIAARFAALGIGTETNGSIICPAAMNGVVGVKPTVGLLSRTHIVPISVTQDTAGPMTLSVADAALMLEVMAGSDPTDAATSLADENKTSYSQQLTATIKGKRLGVLRSTQSSHPAIIEAFNESLATLESLGVELVNIDALETPDGFWDKSLKLLLIEFKQTLNHYLSNTPTINKHRTLADLILFNAQSARELALFDQSIFEQAQETQGYNDEYEDIKQFLSDATRKNGIDKLLSEYQVDALVAPSQTPAFLIDPIFGDSFPGGNAGAGWMAAIAGYPQVSIPMGSMKGLPLNISFIGKAWDEQLLLNIAWQLEQAAPKLMMPSFAGSGFDHFETQKALAPLSK
ncbi:amidase [Agaribacter marinus]|uniref:Amidase n=1 Tax=Agaribacter marinus TaxID=1431249 RepID=A0AA37SYB6_9ALTE|nr:amidase [Agaribacter marinus]GLR71347.1 amidase [Agaribacter marinus]